ncbi:MAG: hypothetical protein LBT10_00225 [Methanobrevibacter sp.]|jgi:hypothetical protein|nr:hypothetical protein [Methanobrevibacter sp.]
MAQPIKPTPTQYGKHADEFMRMISEPPSEEKKEFMRKIKKRFENLDPLVKE